MSNWATREGESGGSLTAIGLVIRSLVVGQRLVMV